MENSLLKSIELIELGMSIIKDDSNKAEELVKYLNTQDSSIYNEGSFNLYDFFDHSNNLTFKYVIANLDNYPNIEKIRWDLAIIQPLIEQYRNSLISDKDLSNFIETQLQKGEALENYQLSSLIRLANIAHDYNKLYEIKQLIELGVKK